MFVADPVLVLAMVATSAVAALVLPPHGTVPVNVGAGWGLTWIPKTIPLVMWPAVGVVSYLATLLPVASGQLSVRSQVGLTIALGLMLLTQTGSVLLAISRRGRR
jgi:hypothetical protein